jgi:hypothetical protein
LEKKAEEEIKVEGVGEEGARPGEGEEAKVSGGGKPARWGGPAVQWPKGVVS